MTNHLACFGSEYSNNIMQEVELQLTDGNNCLLLYADALFRYCWGSALCLPGGVCLDVSGRHPAVRDAY